MQYQAYTVEEFWKCEVFTLKEIQKRQFFSSTEVLP